MSNKIKDRWGSEQICDQIKLEDKIKRISCLKQNWSGYEVMTAVKWYKNDT